jgi:hypothetical protein
MIFKVKVFGKSESENRDKVFFNLKYLEEPDL